MFVFLSFLYLLDKYLTACRAFGIGHSVFDTKDLYDGANMKVVIANIDMLRRSQQVEFILNITFNISFEFLSQKKIKKNN